MRGRFGALDPSELLLHPLDALSRGVDVENPAEARRLRPSFDLSALGFELDFSEVFIDHSVFPHLFDIYVRLELLHDVEELLVVLGEVDQLLAGIEGRIRPEAFFGLSFRVFEFARQVSRSHDEFLRLLSAFGRLARLFELPSESVDFPLVGLNQVLEIFISLLQLFDFFVFFAGKGFERLGVGCDFEFEDFSGGEGSDFKDRDGPGLGASFSGRLGPMQSQPERTKLSLKTSDFFLGGFGFFLGGFGFFLGGFGFFLGGFGFFLGGFGFFLGGFGLFLFGFGLFRAGFKRFDFPLKSEVILKHGLVLAKKPVFFRNRFFDFLLLLLGLLSMQS